MAIVKKTTSDLSSARRLFRNKNGLIFVGRHFVVILATYVLLCYTVALWAEEKPRLTVFFPLGKFSDSASLFPNSKSEFAWTRCLCCLAASFSSPVGSDTVMGSGNKTRPASRPTKSSKTIKLLRASH